MYPSRFVSAPKIEGWSDHAITNSPLLPETRPKTVARNESAVAVPVCATDDAPLPSRQNVIVLFGVWRFIAPSQVLAVSSLHTARNAPAAPDVPDAARAMGVQVAPPSSVR